MKSLHCLLPTAACLLAMAPFAQAGDGSFSAETGERGTATPARIELGLPAGLTAGAASVVLGDRLGRNGVRNTAVESDVYAGYRGKTGSLGYSALIHYYSYPDLHALGAGGRYDHGELSAGVSWHALYARYDYTFTNDYLGILDARGTSYVDVGARHAIGRSTYLNLNAGDGRVAGGGNALWDWRDLRAGFSRQLENGWTMKLNYRRVFGNGLLADRYGVAGRVESREPGIGRGHRGIVLSFKRGF
jgi:hypothetical protein